ncbi:MAG: TRAP transporter small permease [Nitratireductor sp.]
MDEPDDSDVIMTGEIALPGPLVLSLHVMISLVAFCMMSLIFVDVVMRYAFNSPLPGAFEVEQFMLAMLVFLSLPIVVWADENISVALFAGWFRGRAARLLKLTIMAVNVGALYLMGALVLRQPVPTSPSHRQPAT